jgi:hypothetical protein
MWREASKASPRMCGEGGSRLIHFFDEGVIATVQNDDYRIGTASGIVGSTLHSWFCSLDQLSRFEGEELRMDWKGGE